MNFKLKYIAIHLSQTLAVSIFTVLLSHGIEMFVEWRPYPTYINHWEESGRVFLLIFTIVVGVFSLAMKSEVGYYSAQKAQHLADKAERETKAIKDTAKKRGAVEFQAKLKASRDLRESIQREVDEASESVEEVAGKVNDRK